MLGHLYGSRVASLYSWHSFRSGFATALHAAGVEDGLVQLLCCRWACPASLRVYRRLGCQEYSHLLARAAAASVDSIQSCTVTIVSGDASYVQLFDDLWHRDSFSTRPPAPPDCAPATPPPSALVKLSTDNQA